GCRRAAALPRRYSAGPGPAVPPAAGWPAARRTRCRRGTSGNRTASPARAARRRAWRTGSWTDAGQCAWKVSWSGRERIAAGVFEWRDRGGNLVGTPGLRLRERQQRQAQPVAETHARQQRLERDRIGFDRKEIEDRLQLRAQRPRVGFAAGAGKVA